MTHTTRDILHALLDRHEQPARRNVVRVRLSEADHPAYFAADDSAPRHATNAALRRLADDGALRLRWRKWEEGNWLDAVDLVADQAAALYSLLGRSPRDAQDQALCRLLDGETPHPGWHASFLAWARGQLDAHASVAPLDRDDPQLNRDLLRALAALADLPSPTLERTLSARLFGDSKRLEALRGAIMRVLRRHDPAAATFGDDDWAVLRAHNLDRAPEYVPVAGPLVLRGAVALDGPAIAIGLFQPSVALSAAMLRDAAVASCDARCLVTVENATSFNELLLARPPDVLVIYTGGFASPTVIRLLRAIRSARPAIPALHWGDLDAGGLRILAHLREQAGPFAPLLMDAPTLAAYGAFAQPLTPGDRAALAELRSRAALADCTPLIDALLALDTKLEQEAVDIGALISQIGAAVG